MRGYPMMKFLKTAALSAALVCAASAAQAGTYAFSYTSGATTLSGRFTGTLQNDGNTVLIDSLVGNTVRYNGVGGAPLPVLLTANAFYDVDFKGRAPSVTFDGSWVDFMACTDLSCFEGVVFDPDTIAFVYPVAVSSDAWGGVNEEFDSSKWTLSAVPEPATWGLMIAGFAGAGLALRRRRELTLAA